MSLLPASAVLIYDVGSGPSSVHTPSSFNPVFLRQPLEQVGLTPQVLLHQLDWYHGGRNPNNRKQLTKQVANAFILNYGEEKDPAPELHAILTSSPSHVLQTPSLFIVDDPEGHATIGKVSETLQLHSLLNKFEVTSAQANANPFEWIYQLL